MILQDQYESGFALDLMLKGLQIVLSMARAMGVPAFATSLSSHKRTRLDMDRKNTLPLSCFIKTPRRLPLLPVVFDIRVRLPDEIGKDY